MMKKKKKTPKVKNVPKEPKSFVCLVDGKVICRLEISC